MLPPFQTHNGQKGAKMILTAKRREKTYITSYTAIIGSHEAHKAGFLNEDGTSKVLRKIVDEENHRIIIELDPDRNRAQE